MTRIERWVALVWGIVLFGLSAVIIANATPAAELCWEQPGEIAARGYVVTVAGISVNPEVVDHGDKFCATVDLTEPYSWDVAAVGQDVAPGLIPVDYSIPSSNGPQVRWDMACRGDYDANGQISLSDVNAVLSGVGEVCSP